MRRAVSRCKVEGMAQLSAWVIATGLDKRAEAACSRTIATTCIVSTHQDAQVNAAHDYSFYRHPLSVLRGLI